MQFRAFITKSTPTLTQYALQILQNQQNQTLRNISIYSYIYHFTYFLFNFTYFLFN
ncbi:hypothetical protein HMPREF1583_01072 [Gardnerella vaginalis JCP8151B]|nr:hypothetical protein HMPREF1586_01343 [Gardnerella vaginalis JCP8522]EPI46026.1 hypothetical protein HMPREF1583_01072 [Gardnerella vaginalis JCP8151B]